MAKQVVSTSSCTKNHYSKFIEAGRGGPKWKIRMGWVLCFLMMNGAYADDYFDQITTASNGRLIRFQQDVVTVYAAVLPLEAKLAKTYDTLLPESLKLWEEATQGKLQFQSAPTADVADIYIQWTNQRRKRGSYEHLGEAVLIRQSDDVQVEIEIALQGATTIALLAPEVIKTALLHELGHAIGLWGHSDAPNDVMYFAATAQKPTVRDMATWLKVHETPVDTPFHDQAIDALQTAIQKGSDVAKSYYSLGTVYADQGDYQSAVEAFQKALVVDPMMTISAAQIGQIFQKRGKYSLAIKNYRRSLGTKPSSEVLGALGTLSLLQGEFGRAVDELQHALRLAPESTTLNQNLLAAYHRWGFQKLKAGHVAEAIKCFDRGLVRFPFSEILLFDLATAYEYAGEYQKALEVYERVLQINPEYTHAKLNIATTLNNLGTQRADNEDWVGAMAFYQRALGHDPDCWHARQNLEEVLLLTGWKKSQNRDFKGAIQVYQKLLTLNSQNDQAYNNLGVIYLAQQDYDQSIAYFKQAFSLNPEHEEARANWNYVKRKRLFERIKKAFGPALLVLFVTFIIMKQLAKRKPQSADSH